MVDVRIRLHRRCGLTTAITVLLCICASVILVVNFDPWVDEAKYSAGDNDISLSLKVQSEADTANVLPGIASEPIIPRVFKTDVWEKTEGPYWLAPLPVHPYQNCQRRSTVACQLRTEGKQHLLVLLWTRVNNRELFGGRPLSIDFQCCDGIVWTYTTDKSLLKEADVVEFQGHDIRNEEDLLAVPRRTSDSIQLFSYYSWEAKPVLPDLFANVKFNLQRTYRNSADLHCPYHKHGVCVLNSTLAPLPVKFEQKSSTPVLAVVSNCKSRSGREYILSNLMTLIEVHSAGACMSNFAVETAGLRDKNQMIRELGSEGPSRIEFMSQYKFVFAVENRLCQDYISEKFWRSLESGAVPIVGTFDRTPNYHLVSPHDQSFIDTSAFPSVFSFANYLQRAAVHKELYMQHHQYRKRPFPGSAYDAGGADAAFITRHATPGKDPEGWCKLANCMTNSTCVQQLQHRELTLNDVQTCTEDNVLKAI